MSRMRKYNKIVGRIVGRFGGSKKGSDNNKTFRGKEVLSDAVKVIRKVIDKTFRRRVSKVEERTWESISLSEAVKVIRKVIEKEGGFCRDPLNPLDYEALEILTKLEKSGDPYVKACARVVLEARSIFAKDLGQVE